MKRIKLEPKTYRAVFVKWQDSCSWKRSWWQAADLAEELKKNENDYFWTHAYIIGENKTSYLFANSVHYEDGNAISFSQLFTIPKGCIEEIKYVKALHNYAFPKERVLR